MVVSITDLASAMRLGDGVAAPPEPVASILTRLMAVASATVEHRASDAPDDIKDEAVIRMASYLYDQPTAASGDRYAGAFRNSGAASLLGPWVQRRAQ